MPAKPEKLGSENVDMVVIVDSLDQPVAHMEKYRAHELGRLHRAFSVFVFNARQELLLQRRALNKYHSAGLWSNTCCSHPRPGESVGSAAQRRLREEMGMECSLAPAFSFMYKAHFQNGLIEHEFDHVLIGYSDELPRPDPREVLEWRHAPIAAIRSELSGNGDAFTPWFRMCFERVVEAADVHTPLVQAAA